MKNLQTKQINRNSPKDAGKYLQWLLAAIIIVSIISLVKTIHGTEMNSLLLLDSINHSEAIYFEYGKYELRKEAYAVIDKVAELMNGDMERKLFITGFTDDLGSEGFNMELSLKRANAVRDYLVNNGISSEYLVVNARGMNEPVNDNSNEEQRSMNRRVILSFIDPSKNTGKNAIDNFRGRRYYAESTKENEFVNSMIKVNSRNEITADLSIRDSAGIPVDSIKAEDIEATLKWDSDGKIDSTAGFPRLIPIDDRKKIAFSLTMDYSGSMYGVDDYDKNTPKSDKIIAMEKSVEQFISMLASNMYCKIIKFGEKVLPPLRYTKSKEVLYRVLEDNSFPMGGTALYSSIFIALSDTVFQSNPTVMKTIIAFTDGMENSSVKVTLDSIYIKSAATNTKIFTIGLYNDVGTYRPNEDELKRRKADMLSIARNSGGFFYQANEPGELKKIYANIMDQVLKSYSISIVWNSENLPPKGTQVKAEVKINVKGNTRIIYRNYVIE